MQDADLHPRAVMGWATTDPRTSLITEILGMDPSHHDGDFARYCAKNDIRRSRGRAESRYDNAVAGSPFATYKNELIHYRPWFTTATLKKENFD